MKIKMKPYLAIVLIFFCIQNITTRKLRSKSKSKLKDKFFDLVPKTPQIFEHIVLTPEEEVLFDYLQNIGQEEFKNNNVVIKVVGGWVRDKLLGRPANDSDIIIDGLNDPLSAIKFAHKASNNNDDVVKWEMDGLEVGTTKIKGLLIDVASRTDTCPISGFTVRSLPLEDDAEQRDFTINSLHYDIVLQKVEDWTNKGMNDLKAGIMRKNTVKTIKNQPYLVLRLIRLTTRYQFKIETETEKQVDSDEVRQSFNEKAGIKNTRQNC